MTMRDCAVSTAAFSPADIRSGSLLLAADRHGVGVWFGGRRLGLPQGGMSRLRNQLSIRNIEIDERLLLAALGNDAFLVEYRSRVSEETEHAARLIRVLIKPEAERTNVYVLKYRPSRSRASSRALTALGFTAAAALAAAAMLRCL